MMKSIRQIFTRRSKPKLYTGRGEDFRYWDKYLMQEKAKVRGQEIPRLFVGYKKMCQHDWYYDETLPMTTVSKRKQVDAKMPLVKPIPEWSIFLGDRVEVLVGRDKGKIGEVVEIVKERNWCFVEGLHLKYEDVGSNTLKPHLRGIPNIVSRERPLLVTHEVKLIDPADQRATEFEWRYTEQGERVRVSVRSGRIIPIPYRHKNTWEDYTRAWETKPGKKDTTDANLSKVTYEPKLCTFEEDIAASTGFELTPRKKRSYWY